jgi:hypothetical protein
MNSLQNTIDVVAEELSRRGYDVTSKNNRLFYRGVELGDILFHRGSTGDGNVSVYMPGSYRRNEDLNGWSINMEPDEDGIYRSNSKNTIGHHSLSEINTVADMIKRYLDMI